MSKRTEVYGDVESGLETPLIARELSASSTPALVVFPVLSEVDECSELLPLWLEFMKSKRSIHTLPETVSGQRFIPENEAERARVLNYALAAPDDSIFLTSVSGLLAPAPPPEDLVASQFTLKVGDETSISTLLRRIVEMDYDDELECGIPGEFSRRGGIVDIFSPAHDHPARIEFFGDTIESIRLFHSETQRTFKRIDEYEIIAKSAINESGESCFIDYFTKSHPTLIIVYPERCAEHLARFEDESTARRWETILGDDKSTIKTLLLDSAETNPLKKATPTGVVRTAHLLGDPDAEITEKDEFHSELRRQLAVGRIKQWLDTGYTILVSAPFENSKTLVREWCEENGLKKNALATTAEHIPFGLTFPTLKRVLITEKELLTASRTKTALPSPPSFEAEDDSPTIGTNTPMDAAEFADLEPGDYAVHFDHGICVYHGTCLIKDEGVECEMFKLEFADDVTAFVPLSQAHMLSKYIGSTKDLPSLTKKGGEQWLKSKVAAARDIKEMAEGLLRLQAMRLKRKGREFRGDTLWEHVFEESFPHEETPDQRTATDAVKADMASPRPMDRLICGDVGYGKTEIAMRAAFKAVMDECQVAVMVPTTILAQQHFLSFTERFAAQPVTIEMLSRFKTHAEQKKTLAKLAEGKLDIVIGTHRLAQKDVSFA
ncbi:MAG: DEAD/DEAH box helicase, partial [Victivallales bacterium]|nr:DEAD/DEAH box helicase [Victivallales bacterium]